MLPLISVCTSNINCDTSMLQSNPDPICVWGVRLIVSLSWENERVYWKIWPVFMFPYTNIKFFSFKGFTIG